MNVFMAISRLRQQAIARNGIVSLPTEYGLIRHEASEQICSEK
jgi:hypothetical protein